MKNILIFALLLIILGGVVWQYQKNNTVVPEEVPNTISTEENTDLPNEVPDTANENINANDSLTYKDLIVVKNLNVEEVTSPLIVEGEARGTWYFEASFPVTVTNWDGLIIAQGIAQAQSDWMTEEYVPFEVTLTFDSPYSSGDPDFMQRGSLILQKDNPSGLPENDEAFEIPVMFAPVQ